MTMLCERCKKEVYEIETCNYCKRKICHSCVKASQRKAKVNRLVICKDCWGKIPMRSLYKRALTPETAELLEITSTENA